MWVGSMDAPSRWRTARGSCRGARRPPRRRCRGARAAAGSPAPGPGPPAGTPRPTRESPPNQTLKNSVISNMSPVASK